MCLGISSSFPPAAVCVFLLYRRISIPLLYPLFHRPQSAHPFLLSPPLSNSPSRSHLYRLFRNRNADNIFFIVFYTLVQPLPSTHPYSIVIHHVVYQSNGPSIQICSTLKITQAASGDAFERLISKTIFWSYLVVTPITTLVYVFVGLELSKL